jgi:archaemetzincin
MNGAARWIAAVWLLAACGPSGGPPPSPVTPAPVVAPTVAAAPAVVEPAVEPAAVEPAVGPAVEPAPAPPTIRGEVVLVALGPFPAAQLDAVEEHLKTYAAVDVRRLEPLALPQEAWTAKRKRYRAERLLDFLEAQIPGTPRTTRILGLTAVDISTSKPPHDDWGIFGLGNMPGQAAVVSTFRLKRKARDAAHVQRRLNNTALHEVGHTFGLDHCTEALCPMQDAEGSIANTDAANDRFGPECAAELEAGFPLRRFP